MKTIIYFFLAVLTLTSCGSNKPRIQTTRPSSNGNTSVVTNGTASQIIQHAEGFIGTRYKYGGTTASGMDCSGLIYVSFLEYGHALPRVSRDMAREGSRISLGDVAPGDLLFFRTNKNSRQINHVGFLLRLYL